MPNSDVKSKRVTETGSLGVGPARIRHLTVTTAEGAPRLTITNGNGGSVVLDYLFASAVDTVDAVIPDCGVRVDDIYVSANTNITSVTVIYS